jgi:hypothetical protein
MNAAKPTVWSRAPINHVPEVFAFTASHGVAPLGAEYAARQEAVANMIKGWVPKGIIFGGDNVWPTAIPENSDVSWSYWAEEIAEEVVYPVMGIIELHAGYPILELQRFPYLPEPKTYYMIRTEIITFYILNTENDRDGNDANSDQKAWLERELTNSPTHWNVVVQYGAGWTSTQGLAPGDLNHRWTVTHPRIDALLCGQPLNYERFAIAGYPPVINVGVGGQTQLPFGTVPTAGSVKRITGEYGAVRITATDTELDFSLFEAMGDFPDIIDRVTLNKDETTHLPLRATKATT